MNMYNRMKQDVLLTSGLFVVIVFLALWFSSIKSYVPYSSLFSSYTSYEPFTSASLNYSTATNHQPIDGAVIDHLISPTQDTIYELKKTHKLDIYSDAPGSITADGSGYYNSMGSLVLDENMKRMLSTRGLNATGSPSQIGGAPV